ncbi:MAG: alkaline phosphatase family protein [Candidatus Nanohaloarchaea archaeon]
MSRVAVIGLDGATWRILDPLIEEGELSFFERLKKEGVWGELETTTPPVTASAWPSFMTGKKPESHGIYGFELVDGEEIRTVNGSYIQDERFWEVASSRGKRCCIFNVPVTFPPQDINGLMVSGMTTPSEKNDFTYPSDLKQELLEEFDYEIEARGIYALEEQEFLDEIYRIYEKRKQALDRLRKKEEWDLFVSVIRITDILTHFYPEPEQEEVKELFRDLDSYLERIVGELVSDGYQVIFMSDHGMVMPEYAFDLNSWLEDQGYIKRKKRTSLLERMGVTKDNISDLVNRLGMRSLAKKFVPENIQDAVPDGRTGITHQIEDDKIDLEETDFVATGVGAALVFDFSDQDKLEQLIDELEDIEGPDGGKVFSNFEIKEESDYRGRGPKLVAELKPEFILGDVREGYFDDPPNAYHSYTGIFGAIGEGIKANQRVDASIIDIAPTVLHLMDLDIPGYMEGEVLTELEQNPSEASYSMIDDIEV